MLIFRLRCTAPVGTGGREGGAHQAAPAARAAQSGGQVRLPAAQRHRLMRFGPCTPFSPALAGPAAANRPMPGGLCCCFKAWTAAQWGNGGSYDQPSVFNQQVG
jgi:hypothetical protein